MAQKNDMKHGVMTNRQVKKEFPWVTRDILFRLRERGMLRYLQPDPGSKTFFYVRSEIEAMFKMPERIFSEAEVMAREDRERAARIEALKERIARELVKELRAAN